MKIYKNIEQLKADIKDNVLVVNEDVTFEFSFSIDANLKVNGKITAMDITAWDINAMDITAMDIKARDINAWNINAWNIKARDINAWNINAWNINAMDITAWDIKAGNINAGNISYHAFCCVYNSIKCTSIKARREKHQEPICLGGKLEFKQEQTIIELTLEQIAEKFGKRVEDIKIKK